MGATEKTRVSVFIGTSLDGYIARADGGIAWLDEVEPIEGGDDAGYGEMMASVDALVMGRGSFEKVLEFDPWPYGDKEVIVLSQTLNAVPEALRATVKIDTSSPQTLMERLSKEGYQRIYLDGGKVIQSFLREGLVDDLILTTLPVLIGEGLPLFGALDHDVKLKLLDSRSWENGFVQAKYEVVK